ncbi:MAG: alanine--tRNA ligase [Candidatus Paceibacterota bacterium]
MQANEIREKFLNFFKERGHKIIPSSSLIPENDPSVLFTTAGMHPLVPFLMGEKHPLGKCLVGVQKCIRTGDIDEVGDYCHHTFFEMLGNWSLSDYFKKEAIEWSYEFLTGENYLNLDKNRIAVSVFKGDESAPFDEESFDMWKKLGINEKRIAKLPKKNNWWGPAGITGPCGPDTEIFYWVGDINNIPESFNDDNSLWLEIWNNVFMEYSKNKEGTFEKMVNKNVDTGMGLERTLAIINNFDDNYRTELFWPIIEKIEKLSGLEYGKENDVICLENKGQCYIETRKSFRIIADHLKASIFILGDEKGISPSNNGQGYVLRRLIRRAIRHGKQLNIKFFVNEIADVVIDIYKETYPELLKNKDFIFNNLLQEEEKFEKTLEHGLKEFEKGIDPFILFTTYGFPIELTLELAKEKGQKINMEDFKKKMEEHQKLSHTAGVGMFKGGLADSGEQSIKYHTATHLLLAALRQVLGSHVTQKGSNITEERLRFDFTHGDKMTEEEKKRVEEIVNDKINEKLPVNFVEMLKDDAEKIALHSFSEKYGDMVKVYSIGDEDNGYFSREFCGGPHIKNTEELGKFKIIKEEASSAGVRRIKAILE